MIHKENTSNKFTIDTYFPNSEVTPRRNIEPYFIKEEAKKLLLIKLAKIEQNTNKINHISNSISEVKEELENNHEKIEVGFNNVYELLTKINNKLEPKNIKKINQVRKEKLRDPIYKKHFKLFFENAGNSNKRMIDLKRAQLRLIYSLLFYSGIRINETRFITYDQFQHLIKTGEINLIHHKTGTCKIHLIPNEGREHFQNMLEEIKFLFKTNQLLSFGDQPG